MVVSVVISERNRGAQLKNCLYSIIDAAEIRPNEVVVVDDRSDDGVTRSELLYAIGLRAASFGVSLKIKYREGDGKWKNPAIPRNMAIRATREDADYLWFLEPEMLLFPDTLKRMLAHFTQRPNEKIWVNATRQGFIARALSEEEAKNPEWVWQQEFVWRDPREHFAVRCALVPREAVFLIRGYDESFRGWGHDDTSFVDRLHRSGCHMIGDFNIRILHQAHEIPPMFDGTADKNLAILQAQQLAGTFTVNDEFWGTDR